MYDLGKVYSHLLYLQPFHIFYAIWYILWSFMYIFLVLVFCAKKNLATLAWSRADKILLFLKSQGEQIG
jgi:cellulose synthase/poly-beta-1,6-N-acetylglucosamine synthase-like glycosyltransferase